MMLVGRHKTSGKGIMVGVSLVTAATGTPKAIANVASLTDAVPNYYDLPTGGILNFKGVTAAAATEGLYLEKACTGIAPYYNTDKVTIDSWVMQCINGIPSCNNSLVNDLAPLDATPGTVT